MQNLVASEFTGVPCYHSIVNSESETYAANFKNQEFSACLSTAVKTTTLKTSTLKTSTLKTTSLYAINSSELPYDGNECKLIMISDNFVAAPT